MEKNKTMETLKKAKQAVDQANKVLVSAMQELDDETLDQVAGGGEFDNLPPIDEHPHDPGDAPRY
jgi:hypothetical protein